MKQRRAVSQRGPSGSNEGLHERRRRELIAATAQTIAAHGLSGTTVASVADCAGLSVGIIGFYFEGKDALPLATLQHLVEGYERAWREARCRLCEPLGLFPTSAFGIMPLYEKRRRAASNEACPNRVRDWFCDSNAQRCGNRTVPVSNDYITLQASA